MFRFSFNRREIKAWCLSVRWLLSNHHFSNAQFKYFMHVQVGIGRPGRWMNQPGKVSGRLVNKNPYLCLLINLTHTHTHMEFCVHPARHYWGFHPICATARPPLDESGRIKKAKRGPANRQMEDVKRENTLSLIKPFYLFLQAEWGRQRQEGKRWFMWF